MGQYLLGRKYLENWAAWIVVNAVSVALFAWKGPVAHDTALCAVHGAERGRLARVAAQALTKSRHEHAPHGPYRDASPCSAPKAPARHRLAQALGLRLQQRRLRVAVVPEVLREWCDRQGRTPGPDEQAGIAREQAHRVLRRLDADVVIADTTPLMTALYSHLLFGDETSTLRPLAHQRHYDATLVTGLDLPWVPDGLQRDGPQVREPWTPCCAPRWPEPV
jgi:hypothetical protein